MVLNCVFLSRLVVLNGGSVIDLNLSRLVVLNCVFLSRLVVLNGGS